MSDVRDAQIQEVLLEGRDQQKSQVILEIARPTPQEHGTHGYFVALAELGGATPKTVQMVRAWIDFAIDRYYQTAPQDVAQHFEEILQRLNTQSGLYLKQHTHERVDMALCVIRNAETHLAVHGSPSVLMLYRTATGWRVLDLGAQAEAEGHLFSNVVSGALRPDDRLLLASPHVAEFFTPDRLTKISDGKSIGEVSDHMSRVLGELSSDVSFGYAWVRVARVLTEAAPAPGAGSAPPSARKKLNTSMADLLLKTKSTASILAPPVITMPKDKIVTTLLRHTHRGARIGWEWTRVATRRSAIALRDSAFAQRALERLHPRTVAGAVRTLTRRSVVRFHALPPHRKKVFVVGALLAAVVVAAGGGLLWEQHVLARAGQAAAQNAAVRDAMRSTDEAFTSQRDAAARLLLTDAQEKFTALVQDDLLTTQETNELRAALDALSQKVMREKKLVFTPVSAPTAVRDVAAVAGTTGALEVSGAVLALRNGSLTEVARVAGAVSLFADKEHKRLVVVDAGGALHGVDVRSGATTAISLTRLPEHTSTAAHVFYGGRYYAYDPATKQLYRYEAPTPSAYEKGKRWITDGGSPIGVQFMAADSSLWLVTNAGGPLKYTAGKLQPFRVSGVEPAFERAGRVAVGTVSTNVYLLDSDHPRIVVTNRDGVMVRQLLLPSDTKKIIAFTLDEKETTVTVITDDGRFLVAPII